MTRPRVSICLPNLNKRRFLPDRLASIRSQSFVDWELLVYDSFSDDGSWEYLLDAAGGDPRVRLTQGPREGIYAAWNACVAVARGDFVYIATSDDTMAADCLEKLVAALDSAPSCGLAHCPLRVIDEAGVDVARGWWREHSVFARSYPELADVPHVRRAPLDGLLHLGGVSVYVSVTQLLIRRPVLDAVGPFLPTWGPIGDFNWNMRASLTHDTVHVPSTWAAWRRYAEQASTSLEADPLGRAGEIQRMIDHALDAAGRTVPAGLRGLVFGPWRDRQLRRQTLAAAVRRGRSRGARAARFVAACLTHPRLAADYLRWKRRHGRRSAFDLTDAITNGLRDAGFEFTGPADRGVGDSGEPGLNLPRPV